MELIIESIVEEHAIEAALLWPLRDAATAQPDFDLKRLGQLDERVEAHLDALRIAGDAGLSICKAAIDDEAGEIFAAGVLTVERRDLEGLAEVLDVASEDPALARGLVAALGWAPWSNVAAILPGLLDPGCPPLLWYLGIAACAAHRMDPGPALERALHSDDARLSRRALEAAGELGRSDLLGDVRQHIGAESADVRFGSAWSAALLGDRSAARVLRELSTSGGRRAESAFSLAVRCTDPPAAAEWIRDLASRPEARRTAIIGAGALGDPALVPWLLSFMETPELARLAGEAFTLITGIEIEGEDLLREPPADVQVGPTDDPDDDDVAPDPDEQLPWPDLPAIQSYWQKRRADLAPATRHLLGLPIAPTHLRQVLRDSTQRRRAAAAIELSLLSPDEPLFEVRAPSFRQKQALGS